MSKDNLIEGKVLEIINTYKVVINKGKRDGVSMNQKFLIYHLSKDDMIDEDTGENLGKIEYVVGKGRVIHLQDTMATIETIETTTTSRKTIKKTNNVFGLSNEETIIEPEEELIGFENCKKGFLVKSI